MFMTYFGHVLPHGIVMVNNTIYNAKQKGHTYLNKHAAFNCRFV